MRKVRSILVAACLILSLLASVYAAVPSASADSSGDFIYTLASGGATITRYTGSGGAIVIPSTLGGYPVTSVRAGDFSGCTSVTIPNSVTDIAIGAFFNCRYLTGFVVDTGNPFYLSSPDGVLFNKTATWLLRYPSTKQGAYVVPNSVTSIGAQAFVGVSP